MNYDKKLDELRSAIATECEARRSRGDDYLDAGEVALWLVGHKRAALINYLTELICAVIDQSNDDGEVRAILDAKPEPQPLEELMRLVSETPGIPMWLQLSLDREKCRECCQAALVLRLRPIEDATRDAEDQRAEKQIETRPNLLTEEEICEDSRKQLPN